MIFRAARCIAGATLARRCALALYLLACSAQRIEEEREGRPRCRLQDEREREALCCSCRNLQQQHREKREVYSAAALSLSLHFFSSLFRNSFLPGFLGLRRPTTAALTGARGRLFLLRCSSSSARTRAYVGEESARGVDYFCAGEDARADARGGRDFSLVAARIRQR